MESADSGQRGLAKWKEAQEDICSFVVSAASRAAAVADVARRPLLLDTKEAR